MGHGLYSLPRSFNYQIPHLYTIIRPMKTLLPFRARRTLQLVLALTITAGSGTAHAQLRLPGLNLPLPQRIGPLDTQVVRDPADRLLSSARLPVLRELRLGQINALLQSHRDVLEADPRGEPAVRREIVAWSPSPAGLAAASLAGLSILRQRQLDGLDETMVVFQVPQGADTAQVLAQLRELDPQGSYDFNHVYTGSSARPMAGASAAGAGGVAGPASGAVGLVDSGVDAGHAVFADAALRHWGCDGKSHPHAHGTAVAALMVGKSADFRGVAPGMALYAADIYCDSPTGGSADKIAGALGWLAREQVGVINLSIVGPHNATLERAVGAMLKRGHVLVAAVGNDGPAAPPLYPAGYPGVVGVSAVDKRGRVLPEAARGQQVRFTAPGNNMVSASVGRPPYREVRGTSFAAPIVAALLARSLPRPDRAQAAQALAGLAEQAARSDGIVGREYRIDPSALR